MLRRNLQQQPSFTRSWTGKMPAQCPGFGPDGTFASLPQVQLTASRQQVRDYFDNGWTLTEQLFSGLASEEAFYRRPYHQLRHPMIFYYGHVAALYANKLKMAGLVSRSIHLQFEKLFATGVDEMSWDDLYDGRQDIWPSVQEVFQFRRDVYDMVAEVIETTPLLPMAATENPQASPLWALFMGFEHERIHIETSSVLMRELPLEYLRRPQGWAPLPSALPQRRQEFSMLPMPAGRVTVGKPQATPSFGWDNEYGSETREVLAFSAGNTLVSNAEFLAFVQAGGYATRDFWSADGWGWKEFRHASQPCFWVGQGAQAKLRTIFEEVAMPWHAPVVVNFHEAKAYCAWRTQVEKPATPYRLLTEAEHHSLRDISSHAANTGLRQGGESDVTAMPANRSGFYDVFGNVWQWAEDHFHPLPGSAVHPYYDDFSTPCYDGQHQMIFGGSFISTGDMATRWARFHFRPHFFQHAGFRLARSYGQSHNGSVRYVGA